MSAATRYASPADFTTRALRGETLTVPESATVAALMDTVSRRIDRHCRRVFYPSAASTVRYFTAVSATRLIVDDITTISAVATDDNGDRTYENTWAATDYDAEPYNAAELSRPYTLLAVTPEGVYGWPVGVPKGVKITGTWGWPAIPDEVREACIIEAAGLWQQGKGIGGIVGGGIIGTGGQSLIMHPMAVALLEPYKRVRVGVAV